MLRLRFNFFWQESFIGGGVNFILPIPGNIWYPTLMMLRLIHGYQASIELVSVIDGYLLSQLFISLGITKWWFPILSFLLKFFRRKHTRWAWIFVVSEIKETNSLVRRTWGPYLHTCVYCNIIHDSQVGEAAHVYLWMDG